MSDHERGNMREPIINLPKTVGLWKRPDSPKFITAKNIFDYMNGAGELYVGYRFDHLESYEYEAQNQKSILVELYFMKTSDDAFGLLSLDWEGNPIDLKSGLQINETFEKPFWPRALYEEGLLRLWSDTIYARVMAYHETTESKEAVLAIGHSIVKDRINPPRPGLVEKLPDSFHKDWVLRKDRTSYFRSHLVLNSIYYLGQENMLDLGLSSEAIISPYEKKDSKEKKPIQFLLVRYPDHKHAHQGLARFHRIFLPEHPFRLPSDSSREMINTLLIEDGWLGYKLHGNTLIFIFECPNQETVKTIINQIQEHRL